jgi:aspartate carbamoyltransferase regulatory subunit
MREITVNAIKKGTVIDHIPTDYAFKVAEILKLHLMPNRVVIASNLDSRKLKLKGMVKIADTYLDKRDLQKIALIAPNATVSRIEDFRVIEKTNLERQRLMKNLIRCPNPKCITNNEGVHTKFAVEEESPLVVRCSYCESHLSEEEIELI